MSNDETQAMSGGGDDATQAMPNAGGGDSTRAGGPPPRGDDGGDNRRTWMIILGILLAGLLIGGGIAVAGGGGDDGDGENVVSTSEESTSTSTSTTSTSTTSTTLPASTTGATQPSDDPRIVSFSGNKSSPYVCTPVAPGASVPPVMINFTVSWQTQNTNAVDLSVDGPGVYQSYGGGNGSQPFTYDCSDQTHTYLLTAKGPNGPNATRQISFTIDSTA